MPRMKQADASTAPVAPPPAAPQAVAAVSLPAQKYLIDVDGSPLPYNKDVHDQNPHLRVVHALPTSYVKKVREHIASEAEAKREQAAQIAALEQARINGIEQQKRRDAALREAALSNTMSDEAEQDLLTPGTFVIGEANAEQLVQFANENFGVELDASLPLDELRAEVGMLAGLDAEG